MGMQSDRQTDRQRDRQTDRQKPSWTNLEFVDGHHQHPLEDLREVSEVESVVGLGRGGQELCGDGVVHGRGGADQLGDLGRRWEGREGGREGGGEEVKARGKYGERRWREVRERRVSGYNVQFGSSVCIQCIKA